MTHTQKIMCAAVFLSLAGRAFAAGQGDAADVSWDIFRGDSGLTGATAGTIPDKPILLRRFSLDDEITASPVISGNRMYIGTLSGALVCLDIETGNRAWKYDAGDSIEAPALIVPKERLVVFGTLEGSVIALDLETGKLRWKFATDGQIMGSANYYLDSASRRPIIVVGSYDFSLYFLDARSGNRISSVKTANYINGTPAVDNGLIAFGGCDARIHFVDAEGRREIAAVDTGAYIAGSTCVSHHTAFVGNYEGTFLAVDTVSFAVRWKFQVPGDGKGFVASPAFGGDSVVVGAKSGAIYCFDAMTGSVRWEGFAGAAVDASSLIVTDRVVTVGTTGVLVMHDLATGKKLFSYDLGTPVKSSPAFMRNRLYIAGGNGTIFVFGE